MRHPEQDDGLIEGDGLAAAAQRIAARRIRAARDEDLAQLSEEPWEVLAYVLAERRVPIAVLRDDVADALVMLDHFQAEIDRRRLQLLRMAVDKERGAQMTLADLARLLGKNSPQSAESVLRRLESAVEHDAVKTEAVARAARRHKRQIAQAAESQAAGILALARTLAGERRRLPVDTFGLDEIEEELASLAIGQSPTPRLVVHLRLAVRELRGNLPRQDFLHPTLERGLELLG